MELKLELKLINLTVHGKIFSLVSHKLRYWVQFYSIFLNKKIKCLTQLRFGLSHLREHKFKHNFWDPFNPVCNYGFDIKHLRDISSVTVPSTQIRVTFFRALLKMLNVNCWIILSCLYDKQYEEKTERDTGLYPSFTRSL